MTDARVLSAAATRQGVRGFCADAYAIHHVPGTAVTAAAVVDGIGSTHEVAEWAAIAAQVAVRVGARKTATLGILAAAELNAAPAAADIEPDGVAVLAIAEPGQPTSIAWTGDSRAYGWDGTTLTQLTTDHTIGRYLREVGGKGPIDALTRTGFIHPDDRDEALEALAGSYDNWIRTSLGRSSVATVHATHGNAPLILLTSDGVHDQTTHGALEDVLREHADNPQALVSAVVAAAEPDSRGYRDDATAVALITSFTTSTEEKATA